MKTVGLVLNSKKKNTLEVADKLVKWFKSKGIKIKKPAQIENLKNQEYLTTAYGELAESVDFIVVLGGDGTLLNTARAVAEYQIPLLGINMGFLGFLAEVELNDLYVSLDRLLLGEYFIEERMMLECSVMRDNVQVGEFVALNDIVVTKGAFSRMISLDAFVDDHYVATYPADGIIIASPTGSTAYSLSAGGPIVSPEMDLMLITPICPHTLYSRPLVICPQQFIKIKLRSAMAEVMLTVDGQNGYKLQQHDEILVKKAMWKTKLIRLKEKTFYDILRQKLRESGDIRSV